MQRGNGPAMVCQLRRSDKVTQLLSGQTTDPPVKGRVFSFCNVTHPLTPCNALHGDLTPTRCQVLGYPVKPAAGPLTCDCRQPWVVWHKICCAYGYVWRPCSALSPSLLCCCSSVYPLWGVVFIQQCNLDALLDNPLCDRTSYQGI